MANISISVIRDHDPLFASLLLGTFELLENRWGSELVGYTFSKNIKGKGINFLKIGIPTNKVGYVLP